MNNKRDLIQIVNVRKTVQAGVMPGEVKWVDKQFYAQNSYALKRVENRPWVVLGVSKEEYEKNAGTPKLEVKLDEPTPVESPAEPEPAKKVEEEGDKSKVEKPKGKLAKQVLAKAFADAIGSPTKAALMVGVTPNTFIAWTKGERLRTKKENIKKLDWYKLSAYLSYPLLLKFKQNIIEQCELRLKDKE